MQGSHVLNASSTSAPHFDLANRIRRIVIEQSWRAQVGHIGSALCVAEIIAALYDGILEIAHPGSADRDRFILSKGHAALALYAALYLKGWLVAEQLHSFCQDGSLLGVHPDHTLEGVDFSTGSLGQGLSFGAGAALAAKCQRSCRRVFVLLSDAELNEGSVWEALMFSAHHNLSNLIAIIDWNEQQAFGYTRDVLNLSNITERLSAFGWNVRDVDGHDTGEITQAIKSHDITSGKPLILVARTIFGKGVSFMERSIKWHYSPLSEAEYKRAIFELGGNA